MLPMNGAVSSLTLIPSPEGEREGAVAAFGRRFYGWEGKHAFAQRAVGNAAELGQAGQFQLEHDAVVLDGGIVVGGVVDEAAAGHDTQRPAAGVVFHAGKALHVALVPLGVKRAGAKGPARSQRPLRRDIRLLDLVSDEAFAEVQDAVFRRVVLEIDTVFFHTWIGPIPLNAAAGMPVAGQRGRGLANNVRSGRAPGARRQVHLAVGKIVNPSQACAPTLSAVVIVDETRGHGRGNLVGIADAVAAGEAVVAKQVREAEFRHAGVEVGQGILILVRNVQVIKAWFERLRKQAFAPARVALENKPAVETE